MLGPEGSRLAFTHEDEVHPTVRARSARLTHPVSMAAERVGDHLLELLPAQRGEVGKRALVMQPTAAAARARRARPQATTMRGTCTRRVPGTRAQRRAHHHLDRITRSPTRWSLARKRRVPRSDSLRLHPVDPSQHTETGRSREAIRPKIGQPTHCIV